MNLDVSTRAVGDVTVVAIAGEVDVFSAPALRDDALLSLALQTEALLQSEREV